MYNSDPTLLAIDIFDASGQNNDLTNFFFRKNPNFENPKHAFRFRCHTATIQYLKKYL